MKRWSIAALCGLVFVTAPARAGVSVGIDVPSLNELLPAMTLQEVLVPIAGGQSIRVLLDDLRVVALAPASAASGLDQIVTTVNLRVPALGLDLALEPRMSLGVVEAQGQSWLELRFDRVAIPIPLAGSVDAAPFLTPLRFPAEDLLQVEGARGAVTIRSRVTGVRMDAQGLRFEFDLRVVEPAAGQPAPGAR